MTFHSIAIIVPLSFCLFAGATTIFGALLFEAFYLKLDIATLSHFFSVCTILIG